MKKKEEKQEITVIIPPETEYDSNIYIDPKDCYLARQLKKLGHEDVSVGSRGHTTINGKTYLPKEYFNPSVVNNAFKEGKEIIVTLIEY